MIHALKAGCKAILEANEGQSVGSPVINPDSTILPQTSHSREVILFTHEPDISGDITMTSDFPTINDDDDLTFEPSGIIYF